MFVEAVTWTSGKYKDVQKDMKRLRSMWTEIPQVVGNGSASRCPFVQDATIVRVHTSTGPCPV